jgi:hypothetical protein
MKAKRRLNPDKTILLPIIWPILGIFLALALRLTLIGDMEFKADEKWIAEFLPTVFDRPFSPLATISAHSGVAHSEICYYFLRVISFASNDPLTIGLSIALFNAVAIAIMLWFARRSRLIVLALLMCATSITLVAASRKIWQPDLVAAWDVLAIGLLAFAHERGYARKSDLAMTALAGFCLLMAGHMYLSGAAVAAMVAPLILLHLWLNNRKAAALSWLAGAGAAGVTFLPYVYQMLTRAPGAYSTHSGAYRDYAFDQLLPIIWNVATLPSPLHFYKTYFQPWNNYLAKYYDGPALYIMYTWLALGIVGYTLLFWGSIARIIARWREAFRDPLVVSGLAVCVWIPALLFFVRLGSHLHYWLGTIPFAYYVIAWAATGSASDRYARNLRSLALGCCLVSVLATTQFLYLVHKIGGLPGEYGRTYSSQIQAEKGTSESR